MGTHGFWQRYKYRLIGAGLGVFLNLGILVLAMLTGEGGGALIYLYANFPFYFLAKSFSVSWNYFWGLCIFGGILMYALVGWACGPILEGLDITGKKQPDKNFRHNSEDQKE